MHGSFCSIFFTRAQPLKRRTLLGWHEHIITQTCCTFADLIPIRGASRPGSIVMIAILNSSIFSASFGSTWCSFRSLRKLSMHLGLGLIGSILSTFIVDISLRYIILIFSHHMGIPYNAALCDIMIGLTIIQVVVGPNLLFTHSYTSSMLILSCCRHLYLTSSGCFRCW